MDTELIVILAALGLSAWFSGTEIIFLSFNKARMEAWLRSGKKGAKVVHVLYSNPERYLTTILTGTNLVNVIYASLFALWFARHGWSEEILFFVAPIVLMIFGEILPKAIGVGIADRAIIFTGVLLAWIRLLFYPVVKIIELLVAVMRRTFNVKQRDVGELMDRSDIAHALHQAGREGLIPMDSMTILRRIMRLNTSRVHDIMTPRLSVDAVPIDLPISEARKIMEETGHTRLPVYRDSIDNTIGVIVAHDLLKNPPELEEIIRPIQAIPESLPVIDMIHWLREHGAVFSSVIDEYGGFAGIVSIEDLAEELVGPIQDEYDIHGEGCIKLSERIWLFHGRTRLSLLNQVLGFSPFRESSTSVSGAVIRLFGDVPNIGTEIDLPRIRVRVINSNQKTVGLVRITIKESPHNP